VSHIDVHYTPGPTVAAFIRSMADIAIIMGSRGEGKTTGGIYRLLYKAEQESREKWPLKVAVVRDTYENVKRTVIESLRLERKVRNLPVTGIDGLEPRIVNIAGRVEMHMFGMDTMPDANKFQGMGIGGLWIEEPAPAADLTSGVPVEVLAIGMTSLRQPGWKPFVQITMNPPDEDHWSIKIMDTIRELGLESEHPISVQLLTIVPGENDQNLPIGYRERNRQILLSIGREDLVHRLVEGKIGSVQLGYAVTPDYNRNIHLARGPLPWLPGGQPLRFWDFGLHPAAIIAQQTPSGFLRIFAAFQGENVGLEQLLDNQVIPWLVRRKLNPKRDGKWRDIGDPAGFTPDQTNSERSNVTTLYDVLQATLEPAPKDWSARRDACRGALTKLVGGVPLIQIDPSQDTKPLRRALEGGWHYKRNASGKISEKPMKDIHSHPGDAFGYGVSVLFPQFIRAMRAEEERRRDYDGWRERRGGRGRELILGGHSWMSA